MFADSVLRREVAIRRWPRPWKALLLWLWVLGFAVVGAAAGIEAARIARALSVRPTPQMPRPPAPRACSTIQLRATVGRATFDAWWLADKWSRMARIVPA